MKGMFVKDMEIMRGNMKTFIGVYIIAIFCFLSTSAGPSFLISYVSVLAAVMALNTIASDDMDNGMPYIFTFPISRKEYVKEKYLLGAGMVTVLWAVAVAIAIGVNGVLGRTDRFCSCRSFSCCFRKCGCVSDTVEIWKLYRKAGAACSCIWHHGCRMDWRRTMPENESGFFRSEKSGPAHLEPWNPSLSGDAVCSYVANGSDFLYNIHKDYGEKGVLIRK